MATVKRKCFISYHHADQREVDQFIRDFDHNFDCFTARGLGQEMDPEVIRSSDTDYVMSRIRALYLKGSSVTLVMLGRETWSRRYVDWEIQSSLRRGETIVPNGLLGVRLPSYSAQGFPERLNMNLISPEMKSAGRTECYARVIPYPTSTHALELEIEAAFIRRTTQPNLIVNPRERFANNKPVSPSFQRR